MQQEEAVPESLKNILLVMADGGYLVPPLDNEQPSEIWAETRKRVDRFLPGLFKDVFPETKAPPLDEEENSGRKEDPLPKGVAKQTEPGKQSSTGQTEIGR